MIGSACAKTKQKRNVKLVFVIHTNRLVSICLVIWHPAADLPAAEKSWKGNSLAEVSGWPQGQALQWDLCIFVNLPPNYTHFWCHYVFNLIIMIVSISEVQMTLPQTGQLKTSEAYVSLHCSGSLGVMCGC